jgi:large subunit ribosomal protein L1
MPSTKVGTVVKDPGSMLRDMMAGAEYKERLGTIRMAIGQLGFTPEQMQRNMKAFIEAVKKDMGRLGERSPKEMAEVILSSTNGPGIPLSGEFQSLTPGAITPQELAQVS